MQTRTVINNGKKFFVNVATADDGAVGAGFAVGQLVMKSSDGFWYVTYASGSSPNANIYISQSALPYTSGPIYQQSPFTASIAGYMDYYEQNYPYQLLGSTDGNAYAVYLTGTPPTVTLVVSQSARGPAYVIGYPNVYIATAKPGLLLQSITDGNYYDASLVTSASVTTISMSQVMVSQSWVHPIY